MTEWKLNSMSPSCIPENIKWKIHIQFPVNQKKSLVREVEANKSECSLEVKNYMSRRGICIYFK